MAKKAPASALEALDAEQDEQDRPAAAVAVLEPLPQSQTPENFNPDDIKSDLEDSIERVIDGTATLPDMRRITAAGLSGAALEVEKARIVRLRTAGGRAMLPHEIRDAEAELLTVRADSHQKVAALEAELAEVTARVNAALSAERSIVASLERKIESARTNVQILKDQAPPDLKRLCGNISRMTTKELVTAANALRSDVLTAERIIACRATHEDKEWLALISRNGDSPFILPRLNHASPRERLDIVRSDLPALQARCVRELPGLKERLQQAESALAAAQEAAQAPMRAHVAYWIGKARNRQRLQTPAG